MPAWHPLLVTTAKHTHSCTRVLKDLPAEVALPALPRTARAVTR